MIYEKFEKRKRALEYPAHVEKPKLLDDKLTAAKMTDLELASIPRLRHEYSEALAASQEAVRVYNMKAEVITNAFWGACKSEYAPWASDAMHDLLCSEAYDLGHAYGYSQMEAKYSELATFALAVIEAAGK
jgi:hypothetical protein